MAGYNDRSKCFVVRDCAQVDFTENEGIWMEVKPRAPNAAVNECALISPGDERRFAAVMRDVSDDTRTTPFNATMFDYTTLKSTDFLCFLLGSLDVSNEGLGRRERQLLFSLCPPLKKNFLVCVRIKE